MIWFWFFVALSALSFLDGIYWWRRALRAERARDEWREAAMRLAKAVQSGTRKESSTRLPN